MMMMMTMMMMTMMMMMVEMGMNSFGIPERTPAVRDGFSWWVLPFIIPEERKPPVGSRVIPILASSCQSDNGQVN